MALVSYKCRPFFYRQKEEADASFLWIFSFSDTLLLLLLIFILRLAVSRLDFRLLQQKLAKFSAENSAAVSSEPKKSVLTSQRADWRSEKLINRTLTVLSPILGNAQVQATQDGIITFAKTASITPKRNGFDLQFSSSAFAPNSTALTYLAQRAINQLGLAMASQAVSIKLEVTSEKTAFDEQFPHETWDFSLGRALEAARQMIDAGVSAQYISIVGYAGGQEETKNSISEIKGGSHTLDIAVRLRQKR